MSIRPRSSSECEIVLPGPSRLFSLLCLRRLLGVKIAHRKAENQIKMAKMIMMNELNKRANLLIEQLEVITFSFFLSFLSFSLLWIYMQIIYKCCDVISPESRQKRAHNNMSKLLKTASQELHTFKKKKKRVIDSSHSPAMMLFPVPVINCMHFMGVFIENLRGLPAASGRPAAGGDRDVRPAGPRSEVHHLGYDPPLQRPGDLQQGSGTLTG